MHLQVRIIPLSILLLLCVTILQGCRGTGRETDSRLKAIEEIINSAPAQAAARLDSINPEMLSEPDRHLYTILTTSARDKLFLEMESDSAILEAVRYYSDAPSSYRLAQSSYLAGRVYHGLGDHPSAIRYYQKALDNVPTDSLTSYLRGCVLSQMAALLKSQHLYRQSAHYIREAIKIDCARGDSVNLVFDYQCLAFIYRKDNELLDSAQYLLENSWELSHLLEPKWKNAIKLDMANTLLMRNDVKGALSWLENLKDPLNLNRDKYLYTIVRTYHQANMLDSAYLYAKYLALGENNNNRKTGFEILLSDELYDRIPSDSIKIIVFGLRDALYNYLDKSDSYQAALQTSVYNYSIHERDKEVAEKKADGYSYWIIILTVISTISIVIVLTLIIKSQKREIRYLKANERIRELQAELENHKEVNASVLPSAFNETDTRSEYRDRLRIEIIEMTKNAPNIKTLSKYLAKTESYSCIQELLVKEQGINDKNLWNRIRTDVETAYPSLREQLELLADNDLTERDWEIIWLIKYCITPTQMSVLLMRTKGSISSRRVQLGIKLFGEKLSSPFVDKAIRSL